MKTNIFTILALSIVLLISGCGKETDNKQAINSNQEEDAGLKIESFITKMDQYQQGIPLKSGERWSVDSAIWYIDAALNYTYANVGHSFAKLHRDTLYTEMPLLNGYEAAYEDVFEAYDTFLSGLSHHYYEEVEGDNKQFIMAMVDNMGPLPDNKQKLRIITLTGTGTLSQTGDFGDDEAYSWDKNATLTCLEIPEPGLGSPLIFEAMLRNDFQSQDPSNCRWYYYGAADIVILNYYNYQINSIHTNYIDYKIYAASPLVGSGITSEVSCLNYNSSNGIHEMQFYYDHLKDFVNEWLVSSQNTGNKKLADVSIDSKVSTNPPHLIFHQPKMTYRKRGLACNVAAEIPGDL